MTASEKDAAWSKIRGNHRRRVVIATSAFACGVSIGSVDRVILYNVTPGLAELI